MSRPSLKNLYRELSVENLYATFPRVCCKAPPFRSGGQGGPSRARRHQTITQQKTPRTSNSNFANTARFSSAQGEGPPARRHPPPQLGSPPLHIPRLSPPHPRTTRLPVHQHPAPAVVASHTPTSLPSSTQPGTRPTLVRSTSPGHRVQRACYGRPQRGPGHALVNGHPWPASARVDLVPAVPRIVDVTIDVDRHSSRAGDVDGLGRALLRAAGPRTAHPALPSPTRG